MNEDETVSVSKGVFVFKNKLELSTRKTSKKIKSTKRTSIFAENLWYQSYVNLLDKIKQKIEDLNNEMFSSVLSGLVNFVKTSHDTDVYEIPTAALLTGINMPDHGAQFMALSKQIRQTVSPHVACLYSQDCQSLKQLMEHMIHQFINNEHLFPSDEEKEDMNYIKKSQLNMSLLHRWYECLYEEKKNTTPKKLKTKGKKKVLVVIIPDFESFNVLALQKFILIASWYIEILPFVFIFGIATSITTLHMSLPYQVSSKIDIQLFNSQPSTVYLNNILEQIFFGSNCPFQLGGKVFHILTDIFLFYDLSVSNFIQNIKFAMAEHFSYGNAMALCNFNKKEIASVINNFTAEDCENTRHILSFRKLVENESSENRIKLLTNDEYFKNVLKDEIYKMVEYIRKLHVFLKCLLILVNDLPRVPLGKCVRELYCVAVTENITETSEYRECFQLLNFQAKELLCLKISKMIESLSNDINDNKCNDVKEFLDGLINYLEEINKVEEGISCLDVKDEPVLANQLNRQQLRQKLLEMSKEHSKPITKYEKMRADILQFLSRTFQQNLVKPSSFYFYEIFFFENISIQNYIVGTHRSAIHNALNDPQYYLQCTCCEIENSSIIKPCMPDISIAYKLHLECGRMINLYDWLQAFLSIVDPNKYEDDSKRSVDPKLQARFTQAVSELEYLGFIKSSKRKADHVTRLTWGG